MLSLLLHYCVSITVLPLQVQALTVTVVDLESQLSRQTQATQVLHLLEVLLEVYKTEHIDNACSTSVTVQRACQACLYTLQLLCMQHTSSTKD